MSQPKLVSNVKLFCAISWCHMKIKVFHTKISLENTKLNLV